LSLGVTPYQKSSVLHIYSYAIEMDKRISDEELMVEFQNGDKAAMGELYNRHKKGGVYRYLLRKCNNTSDAEDLFHEVWEKLLVTRSRFKANASFKTWLYTITINHFNDYYRKKMRRKVIHQVNPGCEEEDIVAGENCQPEFQVAKAQQRHMMLEYVATLPAEQRDVFYLREEGGFSIDEIANILKIKKDTAKSRLRYAAIKLHECLHPDE